MSAGSNAQHPAHSKSIRNSAMNSKLFMICHIRKSRQLASGMGITSQGRVRAAFGPRSNYPLSMVPFKDRYAQERR